MKYVQGRGKEGLKRRGGGGGGERRGVMGGKEGGWNEGRERTKLRTEDNTYQSTSGSSCFSIRTILTVSSPILEVLVFMAAD